MSNIIRLRSLKQALSILPNTSNAPRYEIAGRISKVSVFKDKYFLDIRDGSLNQRLQVILNKTTAQAEPHFGGYIKLVGNIVESRGEKQDTELIADEVLFYGDCNPIEYPISSKLEHSAHSHRQNLHLRPRNTVSESLMRIRSESEMAIHQIMNQLGFFKVHTPTLTSNDSEASSDLFKVERTSVKKSHSEIPIDEQQDVRPNSNTDRILKPNYFGKDVFLITSAQLHLEVLAASMSKVYSLANTFRAENSLTRRHLCEFTMLEVEEANVTTIDDLMDRVEVIIKFICQYLASLSAHKSDLKYLHDNFSDLNFNKLWKARYERLSYAEAIAILNENIESANDNQTATENIQSSENDTQATASIARKLLEYGDDIGRAEERRLLRIYDNVPVFITNYPSKLKPFYMKSTEEGDEVECFDLIAPSGGEICGGSLREHRYDVLRAKMLALGLPLNTPTAEQNEPKQDENIAVTEDNPQLSGADGNNDLNWYLESRKFGTFPHGGFGIGFDRLLQAILGINNIRNVVMFPRHPTSCLL